MAATARIDGGAMLIRVLRQAGIDTLFTLHGGHLDAILQAAADDGMRLIDTRHEQAAGHAADGWARTTGRPGVAIVTAGPGMTDCVTAIANAYLDCVPTLFIAGAAPLREAETMPLQGGLDQVAMVTPITKWAHRVTHTERIPDLVAQALRVAVSGRPGPVFLELPIDVLFSRVEESRVAFPEKIFRIRRRRRRRRSSRAPSSGSTPPSVRRSSPGAAPGSRGPGTIFSASRRGRVRRSSRTRRLTGWCRGITRSAVAASPISPSRRGWASARPIWCWCWEPAWVSSRAAGEPG